MHQRIRAGLLAFGTATALILGWTATPALAGPPAAAAPDGHVIALHLRPDGSGRIDSWTPAGGVSAQQLYAMLKAQGVPDLVDPASRSQINEPPTCSINGAWALDERCGNNRWHYAGTHPRVNIMDQTSAGWPVHTKSDKWNTSTAIDTIYHWYTQYSCTGTSNCVWVMNGNYGPTGWVGYTSFFVGTTPLVLTGASIDLNDYCAPGYVCSSGFAHASTACHELGHALGLDHNTFKSSCLYYQPGAATTDNPSTSDFQMLDSIY